MSRETVLALTRAAFPEEDLTGLVGDLVGREDVTVVMADGDAGYAIFTECEVAPGGERVALLGPVAVAPDQQRRGVGSAVIRDGLRALVGAREPARPRCSAVIVLGDPRFYGRFGFSAEHQRVRAPYKLPPHYESAWMALPLGPAGEAAVPAGDLRVPEPWRRPELWQ